MNYSAHIQRIDDDIRLNLRPELKPNLLSRRASLVTERDALFLQELEISRAHAEKMRDKNIWVLTHPSGESGFRCRTCQTLCRELYCHSCRAEQQDFRC